MHEPSERPAVPPRAASSPVLPLLLLAIAPAVGLGVARFAYGLLLPDMRESLHWTYSEAGLMNTANAAGYMAGALLAPAANRRLPPLAAVFAGTALSAASMLLSGCSSLFALLVVFRFLAGFGAAFAFVAGGALAVRLSQADPRRMSFLLGLFYAGPGLGILLSGAGVPALAGHWGAGSWWAIWLVLGGASLLASFLIPLARAGSAGPPPRGQGGGFPARRAWPVLAGYFGFGAGYIAYMTFMIAWVRDAGGGAALQGLFWCLIGVGALASPFVWSWVIARLDGGRAVGALTGVTAVGAALPLVLGGRVGLLASALVFGSAFFSVVAATTAFVRRYAAPRAVPGGIAVMTIVFSLGQTLGPFATGSVIDLLHSVSGGLWISAAVLALGAALCFLQPRLPPPAA